MVTGGGGVAGVRSATEKLIPLLTEPRHTFRIRCDIIICSTSMVQNPP